MRRNNRGLTIIVTVYLVGIISAFFLVKPTTIVLNTKDATFFGVIKTFCLNYWYVFVMWALGLSLLGFIINIFIVYFRGFIYGVLIVCLIKTNIKYLLAITLLEIIFFLPIFLAISYFSIMLSFNNYGNKKMPMINYQKLNLAAIILILIYSTALEIIGGIYA